MSNKNYSSRDGTDIMPPLDPDNNKEQLEEKDIFKKPEPVKEEPQTEELTPEQKKKQSLKEHLARCRAKSIAVRKAKAEEKKKNKKPRGRPKKVKENVEMEVKDVYDEKTHRINEVEVPKEKPPPEDKGSMKDLKQYHEKKEEQKQEVRQQQFNQQQLDYNKLAELVAEKMKPPKQNLPQHPTQPPANSLPTPQQPPQVFNNQKEITNFLTSYTQLVLQNDRNKREKEEQEKRKKNLNTATQNYYKKLPPMNLIKSDNPWDNCFNPR